MLLHLEANFQVNMNMVAEKLKKSYNYIKGQKKEKNPKKQSKKLVWLVKQNYKEELKDMPPYKAYDTGIETPPSANMKEDFNNTDKYRKNDEENPDWPDEEEYRHEIDSNNQPVNNKELSDITDRLERVEKKQDTILANQKSHFEYIAERDSHGDPQLRKQIYERLIKGGDDTSEPEK